MHPTRIVTSAILIDNIIDAYFYIVENYMKAFQSGSVLIMFLLILQDRYLIMETTEKTIVSAGKY